MPSQRKTSQQHTNIPLISLAMSSRPQQNTISNSKTMPLGSFVLSEKTTSILILQTTFSRSPPSTYSPNLVHQESLAPSSTFHATTVSSSKPSITASTNSSLASSKTIMTTSRTTRIPCSVAFMVCTESNCREAVRFTLSS